MSYSYAVFASSAEVNPEEWYSVCDVRVNPFMDLRFVRVLENSMGGDGKFWCAIFYDEVKRPIACLCFSLYRVDGSLLAPRPVQSGINLIRKAIPSFFKF